MQYELPDGSKRSYRVLKVLGSAAKLRTFGTRTRTTVSKYFGDQYKTVLKWPNMPCLWLGPWEKDIYIPVEFCRITAKSLPFGHQLEKHIFNMTAQQGQGDRVEVGANSKGLRENRKASDVVELSVCPICREDLFTDPVLTGPAKSYQI